MPISWVRRTPSWQRAQVTRAMACDDTEEAGLLGALMVWMPWQSVQLGARPLPRFSATPWMLCTNSLSTSW
jgi:hypothetical protein